MIRSIFLQVKYLHSREDCINLPDGNQSSTAAVSETESPDCSSDSSTDISLDKCSKPVQPHLKEFPKRNQRRFNVTYYSRFFWIEYSILKDEAFCFACRHFGMKATIRKGEYIGKRVFVDNGFCRWKDALEHFNTHENSDRHKKAISSWQNFQTIQNNENPSIIVSINHVSDQEIKENRDHIKILLRAASYLGRQGQAFRGHDESKESNDKGNFVELIETMCPLTDPSVQLKINRRYGSFLSSECQNDLITIFGNSIRNDVANHLLKSKYFSILADESKDI